MPDDLPPSPEPTSVSTRILKGIAFVLDDLVRVPGTKRRIGLDPLLGLVPGVGDFVTSAAGLALLATGARRKVPVSVYLRMTGNWLLNALVGAIPFLGDAFSFWFKSNRRNYLLLRAHLDSAGAEEAKSSGWWPLVILLSAAVFLFAMLGFVSVWLYRAVFG